MGEGTGQGTTRVTASQRSIGLLSDVVLAVWAHHLDVAYRYDPYYMARKWRIDPLPHQVDAVADALKIEPLRLLLADEVGLGKTIIAGMLLSELMERGRVQRALIVVPASLLGQWESELRDKFGINVSRLKGEDIDAGVVPSLALASLDTVKKGSRPEVLRSIPWDLVIFDEAHKLSVNPKGVDLEKTKRYELAEKICESAKNALLLTATPHNGNPTDFEYRLRLLDGSVKGGGSNALLSSFTQRLMIRRLKEEVRGLDGYAIFPPRTIGVLPVKPSKEELEFYHAVEDYVSNYYRKAGQDTAVQLALIVLRRRVSSSIYAGVESLRKRLGKLQALKENLEALKERQDVSELMEDMEEALELDEVEDRIRVITPSRTPEELAGEISELQDLLNRGEMLLASGVESKARFVIDEVERLVKKEGRRVIVFTEYRDTLHHLQRLLSERGFSTALIHGGMDMPSRKSSEEALSNGQAQVLVATDAAGEGLNLQAASVVINYELPWNPNRLDQRLGRVHRYKQTRPVLGFNVALEGTIDGFVMEKLMSKLEEIKASLGTDKVYDLVGAIASPELMRSLEEQLMLEPWSPERAEQALDALKQRAKEMMNAMQLLASRHIESHGSRERPPSPLHFVLAWASRRGYRYWLGDGSLTVQVDRAYHRVDEERAWDSRLLKMAIEEYLDKPCLVSVASGCWARAVFVYRVSVQGAKGTLDSQLVAFALKRDGSVEEVPLSTIYDLTPDSSSGEVEVPDDSAVVSLAEARVKDAVDGLSRELSEWAQWREESLQGEFDRKLLEVETLPIGAREAAKRAAEEEYRSKMIEIWEGAKVSPVAPRLVAVVVLRCREELSEEEKRRVESAGYEAVLRFEREHGRSPEDVHEKNLGYDIVSRSLGEVRFIEVKSFKTTGVPELTPNEWNEGSGSAKSLGKRYWLYVVEDALTNPKINPINDPYVNLPVKMVERQKVVTEVRYLAEDWKRFSFG